MSGPDVFECDAVLADSEQPCVGTSGEDRVDPVARRDKRRRDDGERLRRSEEVAHARVRFDAQEGAGVRARSMDAEQPAIGVADVDSVLAEIQHRRTDEGGIRGIIHGRIDPYRIVAGWRVGIARCDLRVGGRVQGDGSAVAQIAAELRPTARRVEGRRVLEATAKPVVVVLAREGQDEHRQ